MLGIRKRTTEKPRAPAVTPDTPGTGKELQYRGEQWIPGFIIIEISELLDAQEESGDELRSAEEGPAGECTGIVTESGEREPEENECGRQKNR